MRSPIPWARGARGVRLRRHSPRHTAIGTQVRSFARHSVVRLGALLLACVFQGRWGQREAGINNGPTGPAAKEQWSAPIEWADRLRDTSVEVPSGTAFGLSVGNFFCSAVTRGALTLNWALLHPVPFLALVLLVLVWVLAATATTTWRPPDPHPLRRQRQGGQIFRAAWRVYGESIPIFAAAGVIFVPVYVLAAAIQWAVFHLTSVAPLVAFDGGDGAVTAFLALLVGGVGGLFQSGVPPALGCLSDETPKVQALIATRPPQARDDGDVTLGRLPGCSFFEHCEQHPAGQSLDGSLAGAILACLCEQRIERRRVSGCDGGADESYQRVQGLTQL